MNYQIFVPVVCAVVCAILAGVNLQLGDPTVAGICAAIALVAIYLAFYSMGAAGMFSEAPR